MAFDLLSTLHLSGWRGSLTIFDGQLTTRPSAEIVDAPWAVVVANGAGGEGPAIVAVKQRAPHFLPCGLRVAPFVGKTLEAAVTRGEPIEGKQRSASHVTSASMLIVDLDSIAADQLARIEARLVDSGLTYLLFSTHSNGRADKPGLRVRLTLPVDAALNSSDYGLAARGLNDLLCEGLADPAGFSLALQQGIWATAAERAEKAFRRMNTAGVCSAAALIAAAPASPEHPDSGQGVRPSALTSVTVGRVREALRWWRASEYKAWIDAGLLVKAVLGDAGFPVWLAWSETAGQDAQEHNDGAYEPARVWAGLSPNLAPEVAAATLFARARDRALAVAREAGVSGDWGAAARAGLIYLKTHHRRVAADNFEEVAT